MTEEVIESSEKEVQEESATLASANLPPILTPYAKSLGFPNTIELIQAVCRIYKAERVPVPTEEMNLNWIYGCSSRQTRNSVRYSAEGTIVYPAGTIGVIFDKIGKTQKHSLPHKDEITTLDVHLGRKIAVTGQKGVGAISLLIWKTLDGQILRTIDCGLCNGISAVKFSPDGLFVAASCQDGDHTLKIFSVDDGSLLASLPSGDKKTLCLAFSDVPLTPGPVWRLLQGGVKHFHLVTYNVATRSLAYKTGGYGADVRKTHVNCAAALPLAIGEDGVASGNEFVLGLSDGTMAFLGRGENKIAGFTPCFTGPVTAVYVTKVKEATADEPAQIKIVAGGANGLIKILDQDLQPLSEWNLYAKDYGLQDIGRVRGFKSICCDKLNRKILYSTSAGEIGEIDLVTGEDVNAGPIVSGHFRDRLLALAAHPIRQECLTAGEDKTLRVWDLENHSVIAWIDLPAPALSATFAPNGHLIVVGLSRKEEEAELGGRIAIVSYLQGKLRIVHVTSEPRDVVTSLVFSPDGSKVFAGSMDSVIYVYDALNNFIVITTLVGHKEGVQSMDIAQNGRYLQSQSVAKEMLLWDITSFTLVARPRDRLEALADIESHWSTRQSLFGLDSLGIFPVQHPEELLCLGQSKDNKLLAVGDDKGLLRLFSAPSVQCFAPAKTFSLHSAGGLSNLSFSVEDHYLLTVGKHDKMLVQWKVAKNSGTSYDNLLVTASESKQEVPSPVVEDIYDHSFVIKGIDYRIENGMSAAHDKLSAQLTNVLGVGYNETVPSTSYSAFPAVQLCGHGEMVTALGKAVVTLEDDGKKIRLWNFSAVQSLDQPQGQARKRDIGCVVSSASGRFVLVGEKGPEPGHLHLFHAPTGQLCVELANDIEGGVGAIGMALNDRLAACLGKDVFHSLYVFKTFNGEWNDAIMIYKGQVSDATVSVLSFSNTLATIGQEYAAADFVTGGKSRIRFWRIEGLNAISSLGNYAAEEVAEVTALARGAVAEVTLSGDVKGQLIAWNGSYAQLIKTFSSAITAMSAYGITGNTYGNNGIVIATRNEITVMTCYGSSTSWTSPWSLTWQDVVQRMDWTSPLYSSGYFGRQGFAHHVTSDPACKQVLISLTNGSLLSLATDSLSVKRVSEGHFAGSKVYEVLTLPSDPNIVMTFCEDGVVRFWDISEPSVISGVALTNCISGGRPATGSLLVAYSLLAHPPTAATFLNDHILLVAVKDADAESQSGSILIMRVGWTMPARRPDLILIHRLHNIGKGAIRQLRVSPEGKYVAACSDDGCAYIFTVEPFPGEDDPQGERRLAATSKDDIAPGVGIFHFVGFLLAHPSGSPVVALDFSVDNRYMRTFGENQARYNGKVEVNFFDFELNATSPSGGGGGGDDSKARRLAAGKVQDVGALEGLRSVSWASVGSPVAPEVRGLAYPADSADLSRPFAVSSLSVSVDSQLVSAGYEDGLVRVFRFPAAGKFSAAVPKSSLKMDSHGSGPVLVSFVKPISPNSHRLVTVGQSDGLVMVWTLV